jgi:wobble nucleotide-excising tRNase
MRPKHYPNLKKLADDMRKRLVYDASNKKKYCLIFAHNGTGKTRLSVAYKNLVKKIDGDGKKKEGALYYNAFTEDLFYWNNDIDNDTDMRLMFNKSSSFFAGLDGFDIESKIRELLDRYDDYLFSIDYEEGCVSFSRKVKNAQNEDTIQENIKISRGEENIFIWCFFLAVAEMAIGGISEYSWVKYIYVDDPITSLDDNNVVAVACHLAQLIKSGEIKVIISTHHALFFNVMLNELGRGGTDVRYLGFNEGKGENFTRSMNDTPFFHHVALLQQLKVVADSGKIYTYHFNVLRNLFEKTAAFHGFEKFADCIKLGDSDEDNRLYNRMVNLMSHGSYSIYDPVEMVDDNKMIFKEILQRFINDHNFNTALFEEE